MNILHITGEYPPYILGGLGTYVGDVAQKLYERGHTVNILVLQGDRATYNQVEEPKNTITVTRKKISLEQFSHLSNSTLLAADIIKKFDLNHFINNPPDIIHVHDWYGALWGAALKHHASIPLVVTSHLPTRAGFTYTGHSINIKLKMQLESLAFRSADIIVAPSVNVAETLEHEYNINRQAITVLSNGVDTDFFCPSQKQTQYQKKIHLVSAARLTEQKGMMYLMDIMHLLVASKLPVNLSIAGTGPLLDDLRRESKRLHIQNHVKFMGFLNKTHLRELYQDASLFINTSIYEPFGLVVLESMATGLPVISFNQGGIREIIHTGVDGILVPPTDTISMAKIITHYLQNRNELLQMRAVARKIATRYDWRHIVKKLESVYQKTITNRHI